METMKTGPKQSEYMVYDSDTLPVFFGTTGQVAEYLQTSKNNVISSASKLRKGIIKSMRGGYTIEKIEGEINL